MDRVLHGLIVEDLPDAQAWLMAATRTAFPGIALTSVDCLADARAAAAACDFDIALIDLGLPDGDGMELIRALADTDTVCVVTTVFSDDTHVFGALQAGAGGYILKDRDRDSIAELLRGIAAGQPPLSPAIARRLLRHFQLSDSVPLVQASAVPPAQAAASNAVVVPTGRDSATDRKAEDDVQLTAREREVLMLIAKGYAVAKVAQLLGITYNTAAGYVKAIYRKLDVSSRAEAALEASRRGLVR